MAQTVIITKGAHTRYTIERDPEGPQCFAHIWELDEAEDNAHQVGNFVRYATALGGFTAPVELLHDAADPDPRVEQTNIIKRDEWARAVKSALGVDVHVR